mgnify:CR=1 FL=1
MGPFPEYETAVMAFTREAMMAMMEAGDELWRTIPKVTVPDLPDLPSAPETSFAYQARFKPIETVSVLAVDDLIHAKLDEWSVMIWEMASQSLNQVMPQVFESLEGACRQGGQVVDASGGPLTVDRLLDALERIDIDFDQNGEPELPYLVTHPDCVRALQEMKVTPAHEARRRAILEKKRKEFDARRRVRKLDRFDN